MARQCETNTKPQIATGQEIARSSARIGASASGKTIDCREPLRETTRESESRNGNDRITFDLRLMLN